MIYTAAQVRSLTGIHVKEGFVYELKENMPLTEINGIENFYPYVDTGEDIGIDAMWFRLENGGDLPAIVLEDELTVADGQHRVLAYLKAKRTTINALVRKNITNN